jgi:hypothetical protein
VYRPEIFVEHDPDGTAYVRVLEQIYNPFPSGPQRTFTNVNSLPNIDGSQTTLISNVHVTQEKYGAFILGSGVVSIYNYSSVGFDGGGSIHGAAIKLERSSAAPTYIQRVFADEQQQPDPTYTLRNVDFLGVEFNGAPIYVRGATARNLSDGGVDTKSTSVSLMNVTFTSANRGLRAWDNTEITIVNSIINVAPSFTHAWVYDDTSTIRYYNVLWCIGATDPTPTDPNCTPNPTAVEEDNVSGSPLDRMIALSSNPLPSVSPFFATQIDRIVVEYSTNNGATWQAMTLPNAGGGGLPAPVGDTRYRIPLNLNTAAYVFRASVQQGGAMVGTYSVTLNEAGQVVP